MSGSATTDTRRSRLIDYLRDRQRRVPVSELAQNFGVTVRTVLRDADALRADGYPLVGARGRGGGLSLVGAASAHAIRHEEDEASREFAAPPHLKFDRTMFVGRAKELAALRSAYSGAEQGRGRVVVLAGEPGIGKTGLANHATKEFVGRGAMVFWGRCLESEGALPYWPWAQIVRGYANALPRNRLKKVLGDGAADIGEIVPEIFTWIPSLERADAVIRPESARFRLFRSLSVLLENASAGRPLVLVLEDLHRADTPSLLLLEFVAQQLSTSKLLVIGTYRDVELGRTQPLTRTLAELNRQPGFLRLSLKGLTEDEIRDLLELTAGKPPDQGLVSTLFRQTEGNPLFVSEMSILLLERQVPFDGYPGSDIQPGTFRVPEGIKEAIGQRLDRLSPEANHLLRAASLLGRAFSLPELRPLLNADSDGRNEREVLDSDILSMLDEATGSRLLENPAGAPHRFQFTHSLIRDTLYQELAALDRVRLHHLAGEAIEKLYSEELQAHLPQLAHHFLEAARGGHTDKAVSYAKRAGHHAAAMVAHEEAVRFFDMALQGLSLLDEPDERTRYELLMSRAESQRAAGELIDARTTFKTAYQLATRLNEGPMCAEAAIAFETTGWLPGMHGLPAVRLLRVALDMLDDRDGAVRARTLASLARALNYCGLFKPAAEVGGQAIEMARKTGDPRTLAVTLSTRLSTRSDPTDIHDRVRFAQEAIRICEQLGESEMTINAEAWLMNDVTEMGDAPLRNEIFNNWRTKVLKLRDPMWLYSLTTMQVGMTVAEGRFEEAEQLTNTAFSQGQKLRGLDSSGIHGAMMFWIRKEQGRLNEVAPALELFMRQRPTDVWRPGLALLFSELERKEEARREFESLATHRFSAVARDALETCALAYLADVCVYVRDRENATHLYERFKPYEDRMISLGVANVLIGPASRYIGELATLMEEWEEAERHFEEASRMAEQMKAPTQLAHISFLYGSMLQRRRGPGDWRRARTLLNDSLRTAQELGMRKLAGKASAALMAREGDQPAVRYLPAGLSQREADVLKLMASGLGNREIGEALFITPNTVANHVKRILQKTGAANRTEAAAFAVRNRLFEP